MKTKLEVKVGPQYYNYSINAISEIPLFFDQYKAKNILVIHGSSSWAKAKPFFTFLDKEDYNFEFLKFSGECSYNSSDEVLNIISSNNIDFIVGVGGGKLTDLVGYSSNLAKLPFGIVPTLASNCAPWTPLSVMYKDDGRSEGITEYYLNQASFLITDPYLILDSPVDYFVAGIADTLAKWFESELITSQDFLLHEPFIQLARNSALYCKETLLDEGITAVNDMKAKKLSNSFLKCSEIVFAVAGLVGGFGDKYARNSAAHVLHDAIGKYVVESQNYLHGEKVAYGILFQLALEDKWKIIDELIIYYEMIGLPKTLKEMNIFLNEEQFDKIAVFMNSTDKIHLLPIEINEEIIKEKIIALEIYIERKSSSY